MSNFTQEKGKKMKKLFLSMFLLVITLGLLPATGTAKIKLTFNNYLPPTHIGSVLSDSWCKEVEKRANGEVKITHYAGGQILKGPKVYEGVTLGIADIGYSALAYTRGRFPEMELCDLPLGMPSAWVATHVANRFYKKYTPKEFGNAKMLFFAGSGPNLVSTTDKKILTLSDLKGQTLRATGRIADTTEALGAIPRPMGIGETYEAVKKSVISGVMLPLETLKSFRLGEVVKYCTADWQVGNVFTFYAVMNQQKWNKLPENIKKIFMDVSEEWVEKSAQGWNQVDISGVEFFKSKGGQIIHLDDAEAVKWNEKVRPVIDRYIEDVTKKGLAKADEIESRIQFIKQTRDELLKAQKEKGIPMPYAD